MTDRPNDPAAELISAPIPADHAHVRGARCKGGIDGSAARPTVAAFLAARAAASATERSATDRSATAERRVIAEPRATAEVADDPTTDVDAGPAPPPVVARPHRAAVSEDPAPPKDSVSPLDPADPQVPPRPEARPRIVEEPAILGLSRVSRSRLGSRLFMWFFVFVYLLIFVQLIVSLLQT
ncbi:MAG TPA: hypothetical protein VGE11_20995 [Pseudonocardia sp.]